MNTGLELVLSCYFTDSGREEEQEDTGRGKTTRGVYSNIRDGCGEKSVGTGLIERSLRGQEGRGGFSRRDSQCTPEGESVVSFLEYSQDHLRVSTTSNRKSLPLRKLLVPL